MIRSKTFILFVIVLVFVPYLMEQTTFAKVAEGCSENLSLLENFLKDDSEPKTHLTFTFAGPRPPTQLAVAYAWLANCAPLLLVPDGKPRRVHSKIENIHIIARKYGVMPPEEMPGTYRGVESAVKALTKTFLDPDAPRRGEWVLPKVKPKRVNEVPFLVPLTRGAVPTGNDPGKTAPVPDEKLKSRIRAGMGYVTTPVEVISRSAEDFKGESVTVEYLGLVNHYELELELLVPVSYALDIAFSLNQEIANKFPGVTRKGYESYAPRYEVSDTPSARSQSDEANAQATINNEVEQRSRELASYFRFTDQTVAEGVKNYLSKQTKDIVPIIVVEPFLPTLQGSVDSPLITIDKFRHPYRAVQPMSPLRIINGVLPSADDPGHAFHVSHLIGGKVEVDGWAGLANDQTIDLLTAGDFERFVKRELNQLKTNFSPPIGRVYNLSFAWESMPCGGLPEKSYVEAKK